MIRPTRRSELRPERERGLTLVEVLVSMLLLAFVTLGSVSLLSMVLGQNQLARYRSMATSLTAERMDLLTSMPFQPVGTYQSYAIPGEVASPGPPPALTADYGSIPDFPEFRRVVTLHYDVPAVGMVQVVTEVIWQDLRRGEKRHTVITYLHPDLEEGS